MSAGLFSSICFSPLFHTDFSCCRLSEHFRLSILRPSNLIRALLRFPFQRVARKNKQTKFHVLPRLVCLLCVSYTFMQRIRNALPHRSCRVNFRTGKRNWLVDEPRSQRRQARFAGGRRYVHDRIHAGGRRAYRPFKNLQRRAIALSNLEALFSAASINQSSI